AVPVAVGDEPFGLGELVDEVVQLEVRGLDRLRQLVALGGVGDLVGLLVQGGQGGTLRRDLLALGRVVLIEAHWRWSFRYRGRAASRASISDVCRAAMSSASASAAADFPLSAVERSSSRSSAS